MRHFATLLALTATAALAGLTGFTGTADAAPFNKTANELRVTQLVNMHRAKVGCKPLRIDARLTKAARLHSQDMASRRYFSHNSIGGVSPWSRIGRAGYPRVGLAENNAAGHTTAAEVVRACMNSAGHRRNIIDCSLRAVGVGIAVGGPYRFYWTRDFGTR